MVDRSVVENVLAVPAAIALSKDNVTANAAKAQEQYASIGQLMAQMQSDTATVGNTVDTPETILVRQTGQMEMEHQVQKLAVEAGYSPDMAIDIRAIMLRDIRDTGIKMQALNKQIAEDKSVSLFSDPAQAIINAFTVPWDQQKLEGLADTQASAKKTLDDITAGVTNSAAAERAIQSSVTAASIQNQYQVMQGLVRNQQRRIGIESLQNNIQSIDFAMKADQAQLSRSLELNRWMNDERNYARLKQQTDIMLEQRNWALEEKQNKKKAMEDRLVYVNTALTKAKLPIISTIYELDAKMNTAEGKATIDDLTDKGRLLADPRYSAMYTDGDPGNVSSYVKSWQRTGKSYTNPDEKTFATLMLTAYNNGQAHKKDGVELTANQFLAKEFDTRFNTVTRDDSTNPNRAQTFTTMAQRASLTTDQNFKRIFAAVIAPQITDANSSVAAHPELVGPMVVNAVQNGTIKPNDAAMFLADFYKASVQIATANSKVFEWTGKNFTNFKTDVDAGGTIGKAAVGVGLVAGGLLAIGTGTAPIIGGAAALGGLGTGFSNALSTKQEYDWTDPVQVQSYIIRKGFLGSTMLTPGSTAPITAKPMGAPL